MFDLIAGNHHGAGWMTTGYAVFLWCLLPFTFTFFLVRLVRDLRALGPCEPRGRLELSDRIFGSCMALLIHSGALFLATHRILTTW